MSAPAFDEAAAEHQRIWPDRKCALTGIGKCSQLVGPCWGGVELCGGHAMEFADSDGEDTPRRLREWMARQERGKGTT